LTGGLSRAEALKVFRSCCNHRHTLFVTDKWLRPHWEIMIVSLCEPIRDDEAEALRSALRQDVPLAFVTQWLSEPTRLAWNEHIAEVARQREQRRLEAVKQGYFLWNDVEACRNCESPAAALSNGLRSAPAVYVTSRQKSRAEHTSQAQSCPFCGANPDSLTWIYFVSPESTWEKLCGRAGWLTVCDACHAQIDFFLEVMN